MCVQHVRLHSVDLRVSKDETISVKIKLRQGGRDQTEQQGQRGVQVIDDQSGKSLIQVSSLAPEIRSAGSEKVKLDISKEVGKLVAQKALEKGIKSVVFDRGGYLYHGRVKAVAEAAREAGLEF